MLKISNKIYVLAFIMMLLSASCSSYQPVDEHDAPEVYDLSKYERVKVGDVLEVVEMIPLFFERDTYPKRPIFLSFLDGNIIIEEQERVHVFSDDGHYIGCSITKSGQGPGEHSMFIGHIVNPFLHTVDLMTADKMISYDSEFTRCEREKKIPTIIGTEGNILFDDGIALSDSRYLLHSNIITSSYKISLYDALKGHELKQWDYSDDIIAYFHLSAKKFFRMPDGEILIAADGYSPFIYGVDKDGNHFYKAIEFKYNDKTISEHISVDDFRKDHNIGRLYLNSGKELPMAQYVNSEKIVTVILTGPDVEKEQYTIVTDRHNCKNYRFEGVDNGDIKAPKIRAMDESFLYSVYPKQDIIDNSGYVLNKVEEADSIMAGIDDEDFVLIKYRFK